MMISGCSGYTENGQYSLGFDGIDDYHQVESWRILYVFQSFAFVWILWQTLIKYLLGIKTNEQDIDVLINNISCKFDNNAAMEDVYLIAYQP